MSGATVLYDVPGPRARRRNALIAVVFGLILAAVVAFVLVTLAGNDQLTAQKWKPFVTATTWTTYLLPGLWGTLKAAALSIVFALVLGGVLGVGRLSEHRWVRMVAGAVVETFRSIPVLILMIFAYYLYAEYAVFPSLQLSFAAVVTGLTLYNGSVIAEIIRSGILSLPSGQSEASQALGLRPGQTMRLILLPQAVTAMLPALISQMVIALKDSALGYAIGYIEVVRSGIQSASFYGNYLPALVIVAIVMILINSGLSFTATRVEQRIRTGRRKETVMTADATGSAQAA
ncbi:amino acid ABC transporter permease [Williamsia deligens]|uniref:Amino acid ABC transporter permease n=1 Tax=Williamsia deligens TaxID=321325 RepID=A0ABW3GCF9_9NOCA|nr:amino acid ABC transporter permease [Williamsia deligens]MCP2195441.1 glutamate transport system permease protein [Williamsia deligens]